MSEGTRIPLAEARALADELVALLGPYCERLEVVGSIRRERETIGDIELLAIPKVDPIRDMFGDPTGEMTDILGEQCRRLIGIGDLRHRLDKNGRNAFGQRYKRLSFNGVGIDLFSTLPPAEYGVLKVIRTGSADFSHRLVTPVEKGGWMPAQMVCREGALWALGGRGEARISTPEEIDVFAALGRPYVPPERREVPS